MNRRKTGSDLHQLYEFAKIDRVGGSREGATQRLFFLYFFKESVIDQEATWSGEGPGWGCAWGTILAFARRKNNE